MAKIEKDAILKVESGLTLNQIQKFFTETPANKVKERPAKGGGSWKYVEGSYVTQVLNSLFGFMWQFEILTPSDQALDMAMKTGSVALQGRLKVKIGDDWVIKEQYGRKEVAFKKGTKDPFIFAIENGRLL